jgi:hypothetical protein
MAEKKNAQSNETANTPEVSETQLREMRIDQLRERARQEGVEHAEQMRHEELVDAISARHRQR